ncbi:TM2 domain-containing protein [Marinospirillum insulare]|uniref:TM2 domain-containing protein n=1 Tax=Marinospirillum insulare TaxID=217169 RepID=A0ABQ5ZUV2_9GAMM|nr:TM2 domain-containing protein [Marinospirillum insulare]GLR63970.1 hypothetical protein GCM10007878_14080 [Marinospirillum insulare]
MSDKKTLPVFLMALFLGGLGIHRFYVGKTGASVSMLLTLGSLGIWTLIDVIMIALGKFSDKENNKITQWT